jgi:hypothetical protein
VLFPVTRTELATSNKRAEGEPEDTAKTNACDKMQWSSMSVPLPEQRNSCTAQQVNATRPLVFHLPTTSDASTRAQVARRGCECCQRCNQTCRPEECSARPVWHLLGSPLSTPGTGNPQSRHNQARLNHSMLDGHRYIGQFVMNYIHSFVLPAAFFRDQSLSSWLLAWKEFV